MLVHLLFLTRVLDSHPQAIELDGEYVKCYLRRAGLYTAMANHEEAVRDYEAAAKLDPSSRGMYME